MPTSVAPMVAAHWPWKQLGNPPGPLQGASLRGGVFLPDSMSDARQIIEIAFGADLTANPDTWPWIDVTSLVLWETGVSITPMGKTDEFAASSAPATCNLTLKNWTGDFTANSSRSQYWPNVKLGTPVRCSLDMGSGPQVRFQGECSNGFEAKWDTTRNYVVCDVVASGIKRRLGQGTNPLRSAMYRTLSAPTAGAVTYWALEDGANSISASSGILGVSPMDITGTVAFGSQAGPAGSASLPDFSGGSLSVSGALPVGAFTTSWRTEFVLLYKAALSATFNRTLRMESGGDVVYWEITNNSTGIALTYVRRFSGATTTVASTTRTDDGLWHSIRLDAQQSGADIAWFLWVDDNIAVNGLITTATLGALSGYTINPGLDATQPPSVGHLVTWAPFFSSVDTRRAFAAWNGESVYARLTRLCAEERITINIVGTAAALMGPQTTDSLINLLTECEAVDGGILQDGLNAGFTYLSQSVLINRAVDLTLDAFADQIQPEFKPAPGDFGHVNGFVATRKNGSSYTYVDATSSMGQGLHGVGKYESSGSFNLYNDGAMLRTKAERPVQLGTVPESRFPTLSLEFAKPSLAALRQLWLIMAPLTRIDINRAADVFGTTWPPLQLALQGYTETWNSKLWTITCNCSPYQPWRVPTLAKQSAASPPSGNENAFRLQGENSRTSGFTAVGASSMVVATDVGFQPWTTTATYPNDFPFYVFVQGQRVTVTAIVGAASPQTFTVDPATIIFGIPDSAQVRVWHAPGLGPANLT